MWMIVFVASIGFLSGSISATPSELKEFFRLHNFDNYNKRQTRDVDVTNCKFITDRTCPDESVKFFIYSLDDTHKLEPINIDTNSSGYKLALSNFNSSLPTKILIHGFNADMKLSMLEEIKTQYLLQKAMNIITIDWADLAIGPCYPAAAWNSRFVGKCTAHFINILRENGATDLHLVGFSLGAHVAGFTANNLKPYMLPRITGLDPAMPGFVGVGKENRLDKSDAEFVDVLHTNAFVQGTAEESGDVDFYMNGGTIQPGCWSESSFLACNHHRSLLYFAESITSPIGFWGWSCSSYFSYVIGRCGRHAPLSLMGEHLDKSIRGMFLIDTNSVSPYSLGNYTGTEAEVILLKTQSD